MSKGLDRLKQSERLRQMALDYIIANPGAIGPEIVQHFGWNKASGGSRILQMAEEGELRRDPFEYLCASAGHQRRQKTFRYYALVEKTKRSEDVVEALGRNLTKQGRAEAGMGKQRSDKRNKWVGNSYRNDPSDREPINNQRGQGAIAAGPRFATYLEAMA